MNVSLYSGILIAIGTLWFGVFRSVSNPLFYLDSHALILVCGGTMAASLIAFPFSRLAALGSTLLNWLSRKKTPDYKVVEELYEASIYYSKYKELATSVEFSHPFIREGFQLLMSENFSEQQLQDILLKRIAAFKKNLQNDAKVLMALSKFPPAFGLLGASTGMISMMLNLSTGGTQKIGSSMAIALVATFWGIGLANLVFLPLSDFANKVAQDDSHTRLIIMEGLVLIKHQQPPHVIVEVLKSHLPAADRSKVKIIRNWGVADQKSKVS